MSNIFIKNYGSYVPSKVVTNDMLAEIVDTSDEWIVQRTGIKERRISEGEDVSSLAINAARKILDKENLDPKDIDLIITATITPDNFVPSVSCMVQKEIGADNAMAFDISAACSGFVYAMQIAYSMMNMNNNFKKAIVIGSEVLSKIVDWEDRGTCVLFGDGAGAVLLEKSNKDKLVDFYSYSIGKKGEALQCGGFDVLNPYVTTKQVKNKKVTMDGREVFKFAVKSIENSVKTLLERNELDINDIDYIVPHQANERIIEFTTHKLGIDKNKIFMNLQHYGNTSSASIAIALSEMNEKGMLKEGMKILLVGFGGGLTVGSLLLEL